MDALIPYVLEWANLLLRWLHVIVAIAWIGSSFYFVWLDNSLLPPKTPELQTKGVSGELWAVHGGGFYNPQKYLVAPPQLPEHLHWFYWEAYSTWLSGFGLMVVLYLFNANTYMVDPRVFDMSPATAIALALGFLVMGWVVYDGICRLWGDQPGGDRMVGIGVLFYVAAATWLACHVFAGRAAFLIMGAMLGTIMSANVFFWIIPGQRKVVASMKAGETPDPIHAQRSKQRSVHNTYFTLPVLFAMLSNHYSMTYSHPHNWLVLILIMCAGVLIRQFFLLRHRGIVDWRYPGAGVAVLLGVAVWLAPPLTQVSVSTSPSPAPDFSSVQAVVTQRCVMCHNAQLASKNIRLDSAQAIQSQAQLIYQQVVVSRAMPMNNATQITEAERTLIQNWVLSGAATLP